MGYVPPHHNIVAVHYGSRMQIRQASIKRKERVQKVHFADLLEQHKKEEEFVGRKSSVYDKQKQIVNELVKKGIFFDKQA
ncbi:hypothetical protein [Alkalihalobacillus sp. BA299]|uniref:hypothetical protein n=1 Tax=Alkalihalobacillus sp. BA299 TaxID=2815938 RepID=UPI001ADBEDE7|nr:hypothetical protein [Alkalihalobacillus sp. BA299]